MMRSASAGERKALAEATRAGLPQIGEAAQRLDRLFPFVPMDPLDTDYRVEWLCKGLFMERKINILFGMEKAGKSRLMAWILSHLYAEKKLWGMTCRSPGRTLYMAGEETRQEVTARLVQYQRNAGILDAEIPWQETLDFCDAAGMRLDRADQRRWLAERLSSGGYRTVIIDPLRRVHGASESSNDEMAQICNDLREWTNRFGLTLIIIHHTGKLGPDDDITRIATWSRGATDLPAVLDWAMYLARRDGVNGQPDRMVLHRKGRAPREEPMVLLDMGHVFHPMQASAQAAQES